MKRTIKCAALLLALALVLACAGCGKKQPSQPDEYGLAPEPSKLDGVDIGNDLEIVSTGRYAGLFVEDGSDETVSDVFCIRVKNTGEQDVQYAHITLSRSGESYEFDISTLPAGQTVQALELSRQPLPDKPEELTAAVSLYAVFSEPLSMQEDLFDITTEQNTITVTNRGDSAVSQVYVYYKNASGDLLLGGITYRVGLTDLGPGETQSCYAGHFSDGSRLPQPPEDAAHWGVTYRWYTEAGRHTLQRYSAAGMAPQFTYAVTRGSRTEVTFARRYRESLSTQPMLEAASLFDILADAGMLVLHSSYIVTRQGQGILFSGPSGIGKSTQAALWQCYAGAEIVNGDRALVRPDTGTVSGVFYAGTSGICRNVTAPLQAVVLLEQGSENRITALRPQEAFARLLSQCAYYQRDAASAARMTELAAQLVTNVPVRQLTCRADGDAVRALEEELRRS